MRFSRRHEVTQIWVSLVQEQPLSSDFGHPKQALERLFSCIEKTQGDIEACVVEEEVSLFSDVALGELVFDDAP